MCPNPKAKSKELREATIPERAISLKVPGIISIFFLNTKGRRITAAKLNLKNTIITGGKSSKASLVKIFPDAPIIETRIKTKNGDTIFIPNSMLTKQRLVKKIGRFKFQ